MVLGSVVSSAIIGGAFGYFIKKGSGLGRKLVSKAHFLPDGLIPGKEYMVEGTGEDFKGQVTGSPSKGLHRSKSKDGASQVLSRGSSTREAEE